MQSVHAQSLTIHSCSGSVVGDMDYDTQHQLGLVDNDIKYWVPVCINLDGNKKFESSVLDCDLGVWSLLGHGTLL